MNLNVTDIIEIGGEQATVCFKTTYNDENYICVAFEEKQLRFEIYKYKYENDKLMVSKVVDEKELTPVMGIFLKEGINESGVPKEVEKFLSELKKDTN